MLDFLDQFSLHVEELQRRLLKRDIRIDGQSTDQRIG